ncbi:hypothetical protein V6N11_039614 [Hibiscus sabdariffa]|uniref:Uncharacterized protein n=1 Tax=Hibiscus sabdariffa TaxID=183260 RepID=A0ABR2SP01_9ROSI
MLSQHQNPTVSSEQHAYDHPGGQPPDGSIVIPVASTRERQASPTPLDWDRFVKKGRGDGLDDSHESSTAMDAEGGLEWNIATDTSTIASSNTENIKNSDLPAEVKDTYTSKVRGSQHEGKHVDGVISFPDEEAAGEKNVVDVAPLASAEKISDTNLFGPWMMVENRHKKAGIGQQGETCDPVRPALSNGHVDANRLKAVDVGSVSQVNKNVAYRESNPRRKSKAGKGRQTAQVFPLVAGQAVEVIEHVPNVKSEVLETSRRGVKIGKRSELRINSKMSPLELVNHLSNQLAAGGQDISGIGPLHKQNVGESLFMDYYSDGDDDPDGELHHVGMELGGDVVVEGRMDK